MGNADSTKPLSCLVGYVDLIHSKVIMNQHFQKFIKFLVGSNVGVRDRTKTLGKGLLIHRAPFTLFARNPRGHRVYVRVPFVCSAAVSTAFYRCVSVRDLLHQTAPGAPATCQEETGHGQGRQQHEQHYDFDPVERRKIDSRK